MSIILDICTIPPDFLLNEPVMLIEQRSVIFGLKLNSYNPTEPFY